MVRKSSRGNPNHDEMGRFCSAPGVSTSEKSPAEYEMVTDLRQSQYADFTPAKTMAEAKAYAFDLGVTPYYEGLDLHTANMCNLCVKDTFEQFPEVRSIVKVIGSKRAIDRAISRDMIPIVEADFMKRYGGRYPKLFIKAAARISVAKTLFRSKGMAYICYPSNGEDAKSRVMAKYSGIYLASANSLRTQIEYRSLIMHKFAPKGTGKNSVKAVIDHEMGHAIERANKISDNESLMRDIKSHYNHKEVKDGLSECAGISSREFFAEVWCEYKNSPDPRPIAMKYGQLMEKIHEKR